jgi:hypothetical protein
MNLLTKFGFIMLLVIDQMSRGSVYMGLVWDKMCCKPRLPKIEYHGFFKYFEMKNKNILQNGGPQICQQ